MARPVEKMCCGEDVLWLDRRWSAALYIVKPPGVGTVWAVPRTVYRTCRAWSLVTSNPGCWLPGGRMNPPTVALHSPRERLWLLYFTLLHPTSPYFTLLNASFPQPFVNCTRWAHKPCPLAAGRGT